MTGHDLGILLRAAERIRNLSVDAAGQGLAEELARIALGRCDGPSNRVSLAASLAGLDSSLRLPPSRSAPRIEKSCYTPRKLLHGYTRTQGDEAFGFTQLLPPGDDLTDVCHASLLIGQPLRSGDAQVSARLANHHHSPATECTDVEIPSSADLR